MQKLKQVFEEQLMTITWFIAAGATLGSMVLSEVMDLEPCTLCWWQRIAMFPLAFILAVGVYRNDKNVMYYVLPISLTGMAISFYHSLLQWGIITEEVISCSINSSCADPQINWLGFITIPFMAFVTFVVINALGLYHLRQQKACEE